MMVKTTNNQNWLQKAAKDQKYIKIFDPQELFGGFVAISFDKSAVPNQIFWLIGAKNNKIMAVDVSKLTFKVKKYLILSVFNDFFKDAQNIELFMQKNRLKSNIIELSPDKITKFVVLDAKDAKNILHF
jgi:hypothetical protein